MLEIESIKNIFLDSITDGVAISDCKLCLLFTNQRGAEILGQTRIALVGKNLGEICTDTFSINFYQECRRAVAQQVPDVWEGFCDRLDIWLKIHAYPSSGGLIVLFQDISQYKQNEALLQQACDELEHQLLRQTVKLKQTNVSIMNQMIERLQAEAALRNTNAHLAQILESITDGFIALDGEWRYSYINQKAEQILHKDEELLGKNIWEVYPQLVNTLFYRECLAAARTETPVEFEYFYPGLNRWLEHKVYPSKSGISIYFQDITKRKQLEAQYQELLKQEQTARIQAEKAQASGTFLLQASQVLATSLDYETTLSTLVRSLVPFLADYCLIHKLEANGRFQAVAAMHCVQEKQQLVEELSSRYENRIESPNSLIAQVLRTQKPILIPNCTYELATSITQDTRLGEIYQELAPKSCLIVPLVAKGQIFGTLFLATAQSGRYYTESDLTLTIDLASRGAIAIHNSLLYQQAIASNRHQNNLATLSQKLHNPLQTIWAWAQMLLMSRRVRDRQRHSSN